MSFENLTRFIEAVGKDQPLQTRLSAARDLAELANIAVKAGSERGLAFTVDEFRAATASQSGGAAELSDDQLGAVAGGIVFSSLSPTQLAIVGKILDDIIDEARRDQGQSPSQRKL